MTLKQRTFSAVRWTTTAAVSRTLLQVGQVAVLARLLEPEDYGLMALVAVVLAFGNLFSDMGMNSAFIQRQEVSLAERSSLFWLNILVSAGVALTVLAVSPVMAHFYGDERLIPLMMLSATTFVLTAMGRQVKMVAEKALHFRPVVLLEIFASVAGFALAVVAALSGLGVYSLVIAGITTAAVGSLLAWIFLADGWRPMWRLRMGDIRSFIGFGGALVVNNIANQINMTLDILLGGMLLSKQALGLFSVPRDLALKIQFMVNPVITRVGFPLIAQVQNDVKMVRSIYLKTLNMAAATNAPIYIGIAFFAPEFITLYLGHGWERSGELLRILALWGGLRSTGNPVGSLLLGMGRADLAMKWNLALLLFYPPLLLLGSLYGPEGMAWMMFAVMAVLFIPGWFFLARPLCGVGLGAYALAALRPFLLSGVAVAPSYLVASLFEGALLRVAVGVGIAAPLYLLVSALYNREWFDAMVDLVNVRRRRPDGAG